MEGNTSSSPAAWTSTAAVLEHGEPSERAPSLVSPAFSPAPSLGLVHAEATAANPPLLTLLGGQYEQGESSSRAASLLPECPSPGLFGFAGESAAWPSDGIPFFSLSSAGALAPQSSDNLVGFAQPSSDSELAPLPQTVRIPSLAVEDVLLHMPPPSQGAGGASTSNFNGSAQPSSIFVLTPLVPPNLQGPLLPVKQEVMEYADTTARRHPDFISLADDDDDGLHDEGAIAYSIPGPVFYPPVPETSSSRALLPLGSDSGLNRLARNSSGHSQKQSFALAAEMPESRYNVFGSWGSSSSPSFARGRWGSSSSPSFARGRWRSCSSSPSFARGRWRSSSSSSTAPGSWVASSSSSPSFAPVSWSSSSSPSTAPGCWGARSSNSHPSLAPSSWGSSSSCPVFAPGSWGASSSSPSFAPSSWGSSAGSTLCFDRSTSFDNYGSSSMSNLSIGGKMLSASDLPPLPRMMRTSRSDGGPGIVFTDPEMAFINKEKNLQELSRTDPKKVKRILYNRAYSATAKVRKVMRTKDLERLVMTLEMERRSLYAELQSLEEGCAALKAEKMKVQMIIGELERQEMLKDAVREGLNAEIQKLNYLKLN